MVLSFAISWAKVIPFSSQRGLSIITISYGLKRRLRRASTQLSTFLRGVKVLWGNKEGMRLSRFLDELTSKREYNLCTFSIPYER